MSKEFKVGLIVTIAIAVLVVGINYLKGESFFANEREYFSVYQSIDGLSTSNPVIINGYKVGFVKKIELHEDGSGKLIVSYVINKRDLKVSQDSKAKIFSSDILGSKAIELMPGNSEIEAQSGSELAGELEVDFADALKAELEPLKNRTESLVKDIDDILLNIKALFDDESTQGLPESFKSLQRSLLSLESTAVRLDQTVAENQGRIKSIVANADNIAQNLASNNDRINHILANAENISDELAKADFLATINNANKAIDDLSSVMAKINEGQGTLGMLVANDSLYNNLNASGASLDRLLEDMRVNPSRYLTFSLISRKDKDGFTKQERKEIEDMAREALKEAGK